MARGWTVLVEDALHQVGTEELWVQWSEPSTNCPLAKSRGYPKRGKPKLVFVERKTTPKGPCAQGPAKVGWRRQLLLDHWPHPTPSSKLSSCCSECARAARTTSPVTHPPASPTLSSTYLPALGPWLLHRIGICLRAKEYAWGFHSLLGIRAQGITARAEHQLCHWTPVTQGKPFTSQELGSWCVRWGSDEQRQVSQLLHSRFPQTAKDKISHTFFQ